MAEDAPLRQRATPAEQASWLPQIAAGGDSNALMSALFTNYDPGIRRYLRRYFKLNEDEAKEVWQETMLDLWKNAHRYDGSRPLAPWVVSAASNRARKLLDTAWRRRRTDLVEDATGDADADAGEAAGSTGAVPVTASMRSTNDGLAAGGGEGATSSEVAPLAVGALRPDQSVVDCVRRGLAKFAQRYPHDARWLFGFELEGRTKASLAAEMDCSLYMFDKLLAQLRVKLQPFIGHCYE